LEYFILYYLFLAIGLALGIEQKHTKSM
jgi:hypothetical protein